MKKLTHWTAQYYDQVEHYYWRPQDFGRITKGQGKSWGYWRDKLHVQETPLNHLLSQLFVMMPLDFTEHILSKSTDKPMKGYQLVNPYHKSAPLNGAVQPDLTFQSQNEILFIEMKVDSYSSLDQFVKYAIAALAYEKAFGIQDSLDLVMLGKSTSFGSMFRPVKTIPDEETLRTQALLGINGAPVWTQAGTQSFVNKSTAKDRERLIAIINRLKLHFLDYQSLGTAIHGYESPDETASKIANSFIAELQSRTLYTSSKESQCH